MLVHQVSEKIKKMDENLLEQINQYIMSNENTM